MVIQEGVLRFSAMHAMAQCQSFFYSIALVVPCENLYTNLNTLMIFSNFLKSKNAVSTYRRWAVFMYFGRTRSKPRPSVITDRCYMEACAAFSRAGARLLNNRNLRHGYCSRGEHSQAPALLNRPPF